MKDDTRLHPLSSVPRSQKYTKIVCRRHDILSYKYTCTENKIYSEKELTHGKFLPRISIKKSKFFQRIPLDGTRSLIIFKLSLFPNELYSLKPTT